MWIDRSTTSAKIRKRDHFFGMAGFVHGNSVVWQSAPLGKALSRVSMRERCMVPRISCAGMRDRDPNLARQHRIQPRVAVDPARQNEPENVSSLAAHLHPSTEFESRVPGMATSSSRPRNWRAAVRMTTHGRRVLKVASGREVDRKWHRPVVPSPQASSIKRHLDY